MRILDSVGNILFPVCSHASSTELTRIYGVASNGVESTRHLKLACAHALMNASVRHIGMCIYIYVPTHVCTKMAA